MAKSYEKIVEKLSKSGLSIYTVKDPVDPDLWLDDNQLEELLTDKLVGKSYEGLPIRTRSKVFKTDVCNALKLRAPKTFEKTQPRFPILNFDTYLQKSNNLQIWNEEIVATRRYVLVRVSDADKVTEIKVVRGSVIAGWDTTKTLTRKYQASYKNNTHTSELVTNEDTLSVKNILAAKHKQAIDNAANSYPTANSILPISELFTKLKALEGVTFEDAGADQERLRGSKLQEIISEKLGYKKYSENGQFPDLVNQLLEIKLQTSPTIDLGYNSPDSVELIEDFPKIENIELKHQDCRYAIIYAKTDGKTVTVKNVVLTTGEKFFTRFTRFEGLVVNGKYQLPIPRSFFRT